MERAWARAATGHAAAGDTQATAARFRFAAAAAALGAARRARGCRAGRAWPPPPASSWRASPTAPSRAITSRPWSPPCKTPATASPMRPASASSRSRLAGQFHVSREEVLATAGVTGRSSLLFLDVDAGARAAQDQSVDRRRQRAQALSRRAADPASRRGVAFALWQKDGRVSVIADDGTVLEPYVAPTLIRLPLVVGRRRRHAGQGFPARCSIATRRCATWCAPRCWSASGAGTCGCKNGIDVQLPESDVGGGARAAGRARPREEPDHARHRRHRSAAARPRDGAAVGRGRAGARRRAQGQEAEKEGRCRMSALQLGLTPKMKPLSPKRSALVAALDVGTSKIACLIGAPQAAPVPGRAAAAQPLDRRARLRPYAGARHQGRRGDRSRRRRSGRAPGRRRSPSGRPRCSFIRWWSRSRPAGRRAS